MCNFLSAIVTRDGTVLTNEMTDSHSDIERHFGLRDSIAGKVAYAKVELSPPKGSRHDDVNSYILRLDEHRAPDWWDDAMQERVSSRLRDLVRRMILPPGAHFRVGGKWIVVGHTTIEVRHAIVFAYDSVKVTAFDASRVTARGASQVTVYDASQVAAFDSVKVTAFDASQVTARDSSQVMALHESRVEVFDSVKVTACDSARVTARDSSQVMVYESARVTAYADAQIIDHRTAAVASE